MNKTGCELVVFVCGFCSLAQVLDGRMYTVVKLIPREVKPKPREERFIILLPAQRMVSRGSYIYPPYLLISAMTSSNLFCCLDYFCGRFGCIEMLLTLNFDGKSILPRTLKKFGQVLSI